MHQPSKEKPCKLILSNREIERRPVIGHGAFIFHFDLFIKSPTSGRLISSRDYQCPPPQKKSSRLPTSTGKVQKIFSLKK